MTVKEIKNLDEFKTLLSSTEGTILVDFSAQWCGPCKFVAPQFERLSTEFTSVVFAKVDVDEADDVAAAENVQAMPTFKFYKNGSQLDEVMGADVKKITTLLQQHA